MASLNITVNNKVNLPDAMQNFIQERRTAEVPEDFVTILTQLTMP